MSIFSQSHHGLTAVATPQADLDCSFGALIFLPSAFSGGWPRLLISRGSSTQWGCPTSGRPLRGDRGASCAPLLISSKPTSGPEWVPVSNPTGKCANEAPIAVTPMSGFHNDSPGRRRRDADPDRGDASPPGFEDHLVCSDAL
jgi:hypothetical protein